MGKSGRSGRLFGSVLAGVGILVLRPLLPSLLQVATEGFFYRETFFETKFLKIDLSRTCDLGLRRLG
jgi:hypothetical protein